MFSSIYFYSEWVRVRARVPVRVQTLSTLCMRVCVCVCGGGGGRRCMAEDNFEQSTKKICENSGLRKPLQ